MELGVEVEAYKEGKLVQSDERKRRATELWSGEGEGRGSIQRKLERKGERILVQGWAGYRLSNRIVEFGLQCAFSFVFVLGHCSPFKKKNVPPSAREHASNRYILLTPLLSLSRSLCQLLSEKLEARQGSQPPPSPLRLIQLSALNIPRKTS